MTPRFRQWLARFALPLIVAALVVGWLVYFHNDALAAHAPGWLKGPLAHLGQKSAAAPEADEDPDNMKNEIPVHTAHVTTATLHRYIEGFGIVSPRPARPGAMAGAANIASPVAGMVAKVLCEAGQQVHVGDPLLQLDDRLAAASVAQAQAALAQAEASRAAVRATPRPAQLRIAELGVEKAQEAVDFAQKNYDRTRQLTTKELTAGKNLTQAAQDLATAQNDLTVAQRQLDLLRAGPIPEDLRQEDAKVAAATATLSAARLQQEMLTVRAPIDATVMAVTVNPGEAVDTTRPLVELIALNRLMVDVDVPAEQVPADALSLRAEILLTRAIGAPATAPALPAAEPLVGQVSFVSPQIDPKTGAVQVGIDLPPNAALRPGTSVRVRIVAEEHKDVLAVPREAVVADENGDNVIALLEGDQATHKHVQAGLQENGLVEVQADGLKEGDTVVTAGAYGLPQATRVKVLD